MLWGTIHYDSMATARLAQHSGLFDPLYSCFHEKTPEFTNRLGMGMSHRSPDTPLDVFFSLQ
jgi:hypothetical protein